MDTYIRIRPLCSRYMERNHIDFSEEAKGVYIYRYSISDCSGPHTADVTYEWDPHVARTNDACAGARILNLIQPTIDTNASACPGPSAPTDSEVDAPTEWGSGTLTGDLWFKFNRSNTNAETLTFTVNGGDFGA